MITEQGNKLVDLTDRLIERLRALLKGVETKQKALVEREFDRLEDLNDRQGRLLNTVKNLRRQRRELWGEILGKDPAEFSELRLGEFFDRFEDPARSRLEEMHTEIKQILRDIQRKSEENATLLQTRLRSHEHLLSALSGDHEQSPTYDRSSDVQSSDSDYSIVIDQEI